MASLWRTIKRKISKNHRGEERRKSNSENPENNAVKPEEPRPGCSTAQEAKPSGKEGKDDTENNASSSTSPSGNHAYESGQPRNEEEMNKGKKGKGKKRMSKDDETVLERLDDEEDCRNGSSLHASSRSSRSSVENTKRESTSENSFENPACENDSLDESLPCSDNKCVASEANNLSKRDNELVIQLQVTEIMNATIDKTNGQQTNQLGEAAAFEDSKDTGINLAQPQDPDVKDSTGNAKEHSQLEQEQVHGIEEAQPKVEPLLSDVLSKKEIEDKISLKLDRGSIVLANWEHLACELGAKPDIKAACRRATEKSPTELLFESFESWNHTANLTVNNLIKLLVDMKRNDAVEVINKAVPAQNRENTVSDEITNDQELLEELAAKLDQESKVLKNWKYLGLKLKVKKEILQEIGNGNSPNAVEKLFDLIYSTMPGLTVEEFKEKMEKINRIDVKDLFTDKTGKMVEVAPLHSDLMCSICYMLNKSSTALKNWRHLASELEIDYDTYKSFEPDPPQSPTSILLEWACSNTNNKFTVQKFCKILAKIKRYDVIEVLEKECGQQFR